MPNIDIDEANAVALSRIVESEPVLVDVVPASEVIDGLEEGVLLHAGPPIEWERMCGPMQRDRGRCNSAGVEGTDRVPSGAPFQGRGTDDGNYHPIDARVRGGEPRVRKQGILHDQRGAWAGAAVWGQ